MSWHIIAVIAWKDIRDAIRNLYILFAIVLPVGLSFLLGIIFTSSADKASLTISVYDPGQSKLTTQLKGQKDLRILKAETPEQVPQQVMKEAIGGIVIPADFDRQVEAGQQPELKVYFNGRGGGGGLASFHQLVREQSWKLVEHNMPVRLTFRDVAQPGGKPSREFNPQATFLVLLLVMSLAMVGAFVVPTLLVEEKEKRTLLALQASPATSSDIVIGKALVGLFYALLTALILLGLNNGWQGNWPLSLLTIVLGALFLILVGLFLGGIFRTTNQVNTWSSIVMVALMLPSWTMMMPFPRELETIFRFVPTYYIGQLIDLSAAGKTTARQVVGPLGVIAVGVAAMFMIVAWRLQHEDSR